MQRFLKYLVTVLSLPPFVWAAEVWEIDPAHTSVQFAVRHLMISTVRGTFATVSGTARIDTQDITRSSVAVTIDAGSIDTQNEKRDAHLRNADFLDVETYPTITFASKRVEKVNDTHYKVTGDLTLHGVTREVVLDVTGSPVPIKDPRGHLRIGGQATTTLNRTDFGITYNSFLETGGVAIGEEVAVTIDIEMVKQDTVSAPAARATAATEPARR